MIGTFSGKTRVSSKSRYGSVKSSFDNCAAGFLPKFNFSLKNLKKTALELWEKLPNCVFFQEINFTWRNGSREIKKQFDNLLIFFCKSPKTNQPKVWKKFSRHLYIQKMKFSSIKQFGSVKSCFGNRANAFLPNARFFPKPAKRNSPRDQRQVIDMFMFLPKTKVSRKSSSKQLKGTFDFRLNV